jgi:hypothetical protein
MLGLPLRKTLGALKLYIEEVVIVLNDADASDYVDQWTLQGVVDHTGYSAICADATNHTTVGVKTYSTGAPWDCSTYKRIMMRMMWVNTNANDLDQAAVYVKYYYDT